MLCTGPVGLLIWVHGVVRAGSTTHGYFTAEKQEAKHWDGDPQLAASLPQHRARMLCKLVVGSRSPVPALNYGSLRSNLI